MKYIGKFKNRISKKCFFGEYDSEKNIVTPVESIFHPNKTGSSISFEELDILCPVSPSKIVCVGKNYKEHAEEFDSKVPEEPLLFLKANSTLSGPSDEILYPELTKRIDYEGEIVLIIGKEAKDVHEKNALDYILGFTCGNDITARDIQRKDGQWARGKSFDKFCPIGPWILLEKQVEDYRQLKINTFLNGKEVQSAKAELMIFSIPYLVSYISKAMTLYPGDVILTGTPAGVGELQNRDEITVEVEQIGRLTNKIIC